MKKLLESSSRMHTNRFDRTPDAPRLSIVISTLNAARTLVRCLKSIDAQTFQSYEVIIIDGGSTDQTASIAKEYASHIYKFLSAPDTGVYDAWNKALAIVRTEWICFMGADDMFTSADSLQRFAAAAVYPEITLVSARVAMTNSEGGVVRVKGESWDMSRMHRYMCVAHPGAWHHRSLFKCHGLFSLDFRMAGDYEFLLRAAKDIRSSFLAEPLVTMELGGVSNKSYWRHVKENYAVLRRQPRNGFFFAMRFTMRAVAGRLLRILGLKSDVER